MCSREWLAAPPYVLLPQQEVTELLKRQASNPPKAQKRLSEEPGVFPPNCH
jgi:hypothetical protein